MAAEVEFHPPQHIAAAPALLPGTCESLQGSVPAAHHSAGLVLEM